MHRDDAISTTHSRSGVRRLDFLIWGLQVGAEAHESEFVRACGQCQRQRPAPHLHLDLDSSVRRRRHFNYDLVQV